MSKIINIDNSTLCPVAECTTKAALKALGFQGVSQNDPMDAGSVVHDGLEAFFRGENHELAFDKSWGEYFPDERVISRDAYEYVNVHDIFTTYCDRHPPENLPFEVLETEKMVGMPLDDEGKIWFWMKRDLKVLDKTTGQIIPVDHKTTGRDLGEYWQKKFRLGSQLTGYIWATGKETGDLCTMARVNAIQMNKLPNSSRKCYTHKMKYSECRKEHTNFALLTYTREPYHLEFWRKDAIILARKLRNIKLGFSDLEVIKHAPMEGTFINGVCDNCDFHKYCRLGKEPKYADALLVHRPWEPWNGDDVKIVDWRG